MRLPDHIAQVSHAVVIGAVLRVDISRIVVRDVAHDKTAPYHGEQSDQAGFWLRYCKRSRELSLAKCENPLWSRCTDVGFGLSSSNAGQQYLQLLLLALQVCMLRLQGMVEVLQVTLALAHPSLSAVQRLLPKRSTL